MKATVEIAAWSPWRSAIHPNNGVVILERKARPMVTPELNPVVRQIGLPKYDHGRAGCGKQLDRDQEQKCPYGTASEQKKRQHTGDKPY
jgi:hypothetical protein